MRRCNCCTEEKPGSTSVCPECGNPGPAVPEETLTALLRPEASSCRLPVRYLFCESHDCSTVYYSATGASRFTKSDLTVRVGSKEAEAPRPLCYCFGHTYESMREEWDQSHRTTALAEIETATKAGACRCRVTNPRGTCCLSEVRRFCDELRESER